VLSVSFKATLFFFFFIHYPWVRTSSWRPFVYAAAVVFKTNRVNNMFGNIKTQITVYVWGLFKLSVRQKQLSIASHAAVSMLAEYSYGHCSLLEVNCVLTVHWIVFDPVIFF